MPRRCFALLCPAARLLALQAEAGRLAANDHIGPDKRRQLLRRR
jgi:hypothetical protein